MRPCLGAHSSRSGCAQRARSPRRADLLGSGRTRASQCRADGSNGPEPWGPRCRRSVCAMPGGMRYPDGGGLAADERARQEPVRLWGAVWIERGASDREWPTASGSPGCRRTGSGGRWRRRTRPGGRPSATRRRSPRGFAAGDLARNNRAAADLGAWLVFQDGIRPGPPASQSRTWGQRGHTPVGAGTSCRAGTLRAGR